MQFSNLTKRKGFKAATRVVLGLVLLSVVFAPVQNIAGSLEISVAHAQSTTPPSTTPSGFSCSITDVSTCFLSVVYLITVSLPSGFAYVTAYIFNFGVQLALNSASYALDFLSQGWAIVRDIANLAFIFILIYIAYTIIVQAETSGIMHMLASVIVMALLINFSFFLTRVVVDAGNILAVQFYNAIYIKTPGADGAPAPIIPSPINNGSFQQPAVKDLSAGIMNALQVQKVLGSDSFATYLNRNGVNGDIGTFFTNVIVGTTVFVAVGVFLVIIAFMFLMMGVKFLVRIIILWFTIIASPLAFVAYAVPNKHVSGYFRLWLRHLLESSIYPAVFLFLFFIITQFLNALAGPNGLIFGLFASGTGTVNNGTDVPGFISIIANVGIRLGLITVLLYYAMQWSDKFSHLTSSVAQTAVSWTANRAGGVSGWAFRNTAGRGASSLARSQTVRDFAASNRTLGKPILAGLRGVAGSNLDFRGIPGAKNVSGRFGVSLANAPKTSFEKQEEKKAKAAEAFAKTLKSDSAYIDQNKGKVGAAIYNSAARPDEQVKDLEKIREAGIEAAIQEYEANYDAQAGHSKGDFKKRIQALEQARTQAEKDIAEHMEAGNITEANKARTNLATNKQLLDQLQKESSKKYTDAIQTLAELPKLGEKRIKELDKARVEQAADIEKSRRLGNAYLPSVGNIEGALKMRGGDKSEKDKAIEHLEHILKGDHGEGHEEGGGHETTAPAAAAPAHGAAPAGGHDTHHLTQEGIRAAVQKYGSNQAAADEILKKIKRLDQRVQDMQEDAVKSRKMGTTIGFGDNANTRPQRTRAEVERSIAERKNPPNIPPSPPQT